VFVFVHGSFVHQKCSNYALTKLLFGLCKFMWIIDLLVTLSSPHLGAPTCPSTPTVLWAKERVTTPYPSVVFTLWIHSWVHRGVWGCVIYWWCIFARMKKQFERFFSIHMMGLMSKWTLKTLVMVSLNWTKWVKRIIYLGCLHRHIYLWSLHKHIYQTLNDYSCNLVNITYI
jgi:hypothetical protein